MSNAILYRAWLGGGVSLEHGHAAFCTRGTLSDCGQWVCHGDTRHRRTSDWCESEAVALSRLAPRIEAMGQRLLEQAAAMREAGGGL